MQIYRSPVIQEIIDYYGTLLRQTDQYSSIAGHLTALSKKMWDGVQQAVPVLFHEINNYHPELAGRGIDQLRSYPFTEGDCRKTVASEYGFADWPAVLRQKSRRYNPEFERALNDLLAGNAKGLQRQLTRFPGLVHRPSPYGHRATLLHYTAGNGVEFWRQQVPHNLPEITQILFRAGADPHATMSVYGGQYDAYALTVSSAHPTAAGISSALQAVWQEYAPDITKQKE